MNAAAAPPVPCERRAESQAYAAEVNQRVFAQWRHAEGDRVVLVFQLDETGRLVSSKVRTSSSEAAASAAMQAFVAASPYPPMPPEAQCLARVKLIASLDGSEAATGARAPAPATAEPRSLWQRWGVLAGGPVLALVAVLLLTRARRG